MINSERESIFYRDSLVMKSMVLLGIPILILGLFAGVLYFLFGDRSPSKDLIITVILAALVAAQLLQMVNRHKLGLQVVLIVLWAGFNLNIVLFSQYVGLSSVGLMLVIFATSVMLKRHWFGLVVALTAFIHLLFYFGHYMQVELLANGPTARLIDIIIYLIFMVVAGIIGSIFQQTLTESLISAEKNLNFFRTIVDQFRSAVIILDKNLIIEEMNSSAVRMLDTTYPKALGKSIFELIPDEIHSEAQEIVSSVLEKTKISGVQLEVQSNYNEKLYLNISAQILQSEKSSPAFIMLNIANMTSQKVSEQNIQRLAFIDHLTQVNNRLSFNYKLNSLVSKMGRDGGTFSLVFFDLDEFKSVNDEHGHHIGDQVLKEFAQRLHNAIRSEDFIARIGGDEFVLLIENLSSDSDLESTLKRLRTVMNLPYQVEDKTISLSFSFGLSNFPDDGEEAEELLRLADQAMYANKPAVS